MLNPVNPLNPGIFLAKAIISTLRLSIHSSSSQISMTTGRPPSQPEMHMTASSKSLSFALNDIYHATADERIA